MKTTSTETVTETWESVVQLHGHSDLPFFWPSTYCLLLLFLSSQINYYRLSVFKIFFNKRLEIRKYFKFPLQESGIIETMIGGMEGKERDFKSYFTIAFNHL